MRTLLRTQQAIKTPSTGVRCNRQIRCHAVAGPWPWNRRKAALPPPPPPPPPSAAPTAPPAVPTLGASQTEQDLLRSSPKWRWPAGIGTDTGSKGFQQRKQQQAPGPTPVHLNMEQDVLRPSPKLKWPAGTTVDSSRNLQLQPQQQWPAQGMPRGSRRNTQLSVQQQQLQQQEALQNLILDSTIKPKWRWPTFPSQSLRQPQQLLQQQQQQDWSPQQQMPPPPPPPPQQLGEAWWQQQQQQALDPQQQVHQQQREAQQQQQAHKSWQWPFVAGAFQTAPEDEFRDRLESMGVDLTGSRGKQLQNQWQQQVPDFDRMNDKEVAQYMNQLRQNRLERVQNKQDDEVVGIAGLYLVMTLVVLLMAALANLPT